MRGVRLFLIAVAIAAPVAAAGAQTPSPAPPTAPHPTPPPTPPPGVGPYGMVPIVSISAQPNPIVFGNTTTISGSLRSNSAGVRMILEWRSFVPRGTFDEIATTTTDRRGDYRFAPKPLVNTVYRVQALSQPSARSEELLVRVRTRVGIRTSRGTVRAGARVRFTGLVFPRHNGRRAYVQRRSPSGRWVTLARPTLRAFDANSSRYGRLLRVRRAGVYRVKVNGHDEHATGYSRTVRVVVL